MQNLEKLFSQLNHVIIGNPLTTKLSVVCLLARGHLLIEDVPGVGKTTLAHALANAFGLPFKRVQFTSDLLPTDILGMTIYNVDSHKFNFRKGPIFTSTLLADEINRATPKTQSALLQAMEEHQVAIEGQQFDLPSPFFVIATQNPLEQSGTFPLPESQLDRFLMRVSLGYPSESNEKQLLLRGKRSYTSDPIITPQELIEMMQHVDSVFVSEAIADYLHTLLSATRGGRFINGLSPRAGLQWLQAARALAYVEGRDKVLPDDIKMLAPYTAGHRLQCVGDGNSLTEITKIIEATEII